MSGLPGRSDAWIRYRNPRANKAFRKRSSGVVFVLRTRDMMRLRVAWSNVSGILKCSFVMDYDSVQE